MADIKLGLYWDSRKQSFPVVRCGSAYTANFIKMILWLMVMSVIPLTLGLNNGLVLTPPMGWLTWQRFRCTVDCHKFPRDCISENLITRTVDRLVSDGYKDAGYSYVGIDDCWLEKERGLDGRMVPNKSQFPNGMKYVSDYVHNKGLKFAMYQDYGNKTCGGYPGVLGHEHIDIQTFVEWEIDYLKLDGCYIDPKLMDTGYPAFGALLNETGKKIVYSCSWPAYLEPDGVKPDYASISEHCNLWRNWDDIDDSWASVVSIMNWFGDNQDRFAPYAGPGHWNDPDMLIIGNFGLSVDQARVQMAIWSIMAAPLLISADLDTMRPEFKEILLNRDIIAIDQDPMGKQGLRVWKWPGSMSASVKTRKGLEVWNRELSDGSHAIAFVSQRVDGVPYSAKFTFDEIRMKRQNYEIKDLYQEEPDRVLKSNEDFEVRINPSGVKFYKFVPKSSNLENTEKGKSSENELNRM